MVDMKSDLAREVDHALGQIFDPMLEKSLVGKRLRVVPMRTAALEVLARVEATFQLPMPEPMQAFGRGVYPEEIDLFAWWQRDAKSIGAVSVTSPDHLRKPAIVCAAIMRTWRSRMIGDGARHAAVVLADRFQLVVAHDAVMPSIEKKLTYVYGTTVLEEFGWKTVTATILEPTFFTPGPAPRVLLHADTPESFEALHEALSSREGTLTIEARLLGYQVMESAAKEVEAILAARREREVQS